jgi:DNA mismatch endonuclease (patch repair protein)
MTDIVDKVTRSRMMSGIGGKDTAPELLIRRELHARGFRYRLHSPALPGKPDLSFPMYKAVIQVNGCFWHRHQCHLFKWPKTRREFWQAKLGANADRDSRNVADLEVLGWRVLTVWECALKGKTRRPISEVAQTTANWIQFGIGSASIEGHNAD